MIPATGTIVQTPHAQDGRTYRIETAGEYPNGTPAVFMRDTGTGVAQMYPADLLTIIPEDDLIDCSGGCGRETHFKEPSWSATSPHPSDGLGEVFCPACWDARTKEDKS